MQENPKGNFSQWNISKISKKGYIIIKIVINTKGLIQNLMEEHASKTQNILNKNKLLPITEFSLFNNIDKSNKM